MKKDIRRNKETKQCLLVNRSALENRDLHNFDLHARLKKKKTVTWDLNR